MKKTLLALASVLFYGSAASAQGQMVFNTAAEVGTEIRILPNALSATSPVSIDFGDGEVKNLPWIQRPRPITAGLPAR